MMREGRAEEEVKQWKELLIVKRIWRETREERRKRENMRGEGMANRTAEEVNQRRRRKTGTGKLTGMSLEAIWAVCSSKPE
ncbi:hypothetical protein ACOSQ3_014418 [Xanthoceras sorbifolium]